MRVKQHVNVEDRASALMIRRNVGSCHIDLSFGWSREPSPTPWGKRGGRKLDVSYGRSRRKWLGEERQGFSSPCLWRG